MARKTCPTLIRERLAHSPEQLGGLEELFDPAVDRHSLEISPREDSRS